MVPSYNTRFLIRKGMEVAINTSTFYLAATTFEIVGKIQAYKMRNVLETNI